MDGTGSSIDKVIGNARPGRLFQASLRRLPQRLALALIRLRFEIFQRSRHENPSLERIGGIPLLVLPGVMNPSIFRSGHFLVKSLPDDDFSFESSVLDMGTGSGIGALQAAAWTAHVTAVDVNPLAVRCARINVLLNRAEDRIEVLESDLFEKLGGKRFDRVLFNPPYFPGKATTSFGGSMFSEGLAERFATKLPEHLTPNGALYLLLSSRAPEGHFLKQLAQTGFVSHPIAKESVFLEELILFRSERSA